MSGPAYARLEAAFAGVVESPAPERARLLAELARQDPALEAEVRALLAVHEGEVAMLDRPAISVASFFESKPSFSLIGTVVGRVGGAREGGWRVTRHIGRGGWADVYEAIQESPSRRCALKVLRWPWLCTSRTVQRFRDEADLLARVEHPGIAHVYGAGVAEIGGAEAPYMALELVPDAAPITEHAVRAGMTMQERLRMFVEVCDAVGLAHRRGVLHRDLKPSNILVGSDGRARVIDFGVACAIDHTAGGTLTMSGEIIGTIGYMSPERLAVGEGGSPEAPDVRWDVYSLGAILYELVTGTPAYPVKGGMATAIARVVGTSPEPVRRIEPGVARDLGTIIETAMARDAGARYQSVAELRGDVQRFVSSRPIVARPTPLARRVRLAARRNPAVAAAIACSLVGVVAVGVTALRGWRATRQELAATELSLNVLDDAMSTARARRDGNIVKISDLLERLERPLEEDPALSARVKARLHDIVGRTYEDLADYRSALDHYAAGLAAARSVWDEDASLVVRLKVELAGSLYDQGNPTGAARMLEELRAIEGRLDPTVAAKVKNDLAVAYMKAENWAEGERVGLEAYRQRVESLGEMHPATVQSLINLGANAMRLGELELARERLAAGVQRAAAIGREGARPLMHARSYLGLTLAMLGEAEESRRQCADAAAELPQQVGREHPTYLKLELVWAEAALRRGDLEEAGALAADVAGRTGAVLGESHPDTAAQQERAARIVDEARRSRPG